MARGRKNSRGRNDGGLTAPSTPGTRESADLRSSQTYLWRNWTGDQTCRPRRIERPGSSADVERLVAAAAESGERIRAVGAAHSFSDVALTDATMVDLARMNRMLDADRSSGLVKVEAGIDLHNLNRRLWNDHGLALRDLGDIDVQTIAGATSTSTHGTGARAKPIADQIEAVELVTGDGSLREVSSGNDPDLIRAARCGLGALGIVTSVTLRCSPAFTLRRHDHALPLDEALGRFDELADANDHFEFYVFPHTTTALCREIKRVDEPPKPWSRSKSWREEVLLENHAMEIVSRACRRFPSQIPRINRSVTKLLGGTVKQDRSYLVYASVRNVRFTEMEYAIPRASVAEALRRVLEMIPRDGIVVGFPIEVRVLCGDDAYLSTANGRNTVYISVHQYRGMEWKSYLRAVEQIMNDYDGRPHWGKRHFQTAETLAPRYPDWHRFQRVRAELDPQGLFANAYTDRVLGLVTERVPP